MIKSQRGGADHVRHASSDKAVEDDPIDILANYKNSSWRLIGLNLNVLHDPISEKAPG